MLVGSVSSALSAGDALLGALIGINDVSMVCGSLGVELIGLLDDRSSLRPNVVLAGAPDGARNDECAGEKNGAGRFDLHLCTFRSHIGAHWFHLLCVEDNLQHSDQSNSLAKSINK
jgi:hypothetical protein